MKKDLDKVSHSVRASQAVLQYGVGAMVDFPTQTLVTSAPEEWDKKAYIPINDERLAKILRVNGFRLPLKVAYERFPKWYFCPKCRKFMTIDDWIKEKKEKCKHLKNDDEYMVNKMICPECKVGLVVARIVTVCRNGHLNDFPWVNWVHAQSGKKVCSSPKLSIEYTGVASEGLDGVIIKCACGACSSMKEVVNNKNLFSELEAKSGLSFKCEGHHPFKNKHEKCDKYPRVVLRGASSVYFPVTRSSLVIPPYADKLTGDIENSSKFNSLSDTFDLLKDQVEQLIPTFAKSIAEEIGRSSDDVEKILNRKFLTPPADVDFGVKYRFDEYDALTGELNQGEEPSDFCLEKMNVEEYGIPHVKSISLVNKMRVVTALTGFSRLAPVENDNDEGFVYVKDYKTPWYPAYEVNGEGIFIELSSGDIENWINKHSEVLERAKILQNNYDGSIAGKSHPKNISPKFVMLHSLAHLLITQLSFECGYSVASLSERIYCSNPAEGKNMAGILIYTACGDSEGTLGGLVRQGYSDTLPKIFKKAVNSALHCSNDPVCSLSKGQGRESLNLAACHSCLLLPETCCEERNSFLDRCMIIGTSEDRTIGFWSEYV